MNSPAATKLFRSTRILAGAAVGALGLALSTPAFAAGPIRANAVVDVTFDEASGNAVATVPGTDQKYEAVLQNGASRASSPFWNQTGKQSLILDGAKKQFAELRDIPRLDRPDAVSLSFYFLSLHDAADDAFHGLVAKRSADNRGTNYGINFHPKGNVFQVYVNDGRGFKSAVYSASQVVGTRRLVHLTATFAVGDAPGADADANPDDVLIRLFANGDPLTPVSVLGGAASGRDAWLTDLFVPGLLNDVPVTIGASTPGSEYTSGLFDEFQIFPRALSESEAAQLFVEVAGENGRELARRELASAGLSQATPPLINSVSPAGLQVGAMTRLTVSGQILGETPRIEIPLANVKQTVVDGSNAGQLIVDVALPADAATGYFPINVVSGAGVSNSLPIVIDKLPQRAAAETSVEKMAQLPGAFTGVLSGSEQAKVYFNASAGQTFAVEVETRRLGAALDPVVEVKSASGAPLVIEWGRASNRGDVRTEFTAPADGFYFVELHDLSYNAPGANPYRIRIGEAAVIDRAPSPLGPVQVGTEIAEAQPADNNLQPVDAKFAAHKHLPVVVTGTIETAGDEDRYLVDVTPGQPLSLSLATRSLSSALDGELVVLKHPEGTMLAGSEERADNPDPGLEFAVPADVKQVQLLVRDLHRAGGPQFRYRIRIVPPGQPDFRLSLAAPRVNVPQNGSILAEMQVDRVGYGGPIKLRVEGDDSVTIAPAQLPAEGGNRKALVTLSSTKSSPGVMRRIRIVAESEGLNPPIQRTVVVGSGVEPRIPGFADQIPMGIMPAPPLKLALASAPPVLLKGLESTAQLAIAAEGDTATQNLRISLVSTEPDRRVDNNNPAAGNRAKIAAVPNQILPAGVKDQAVRIDVPLDVAEPAIDVVVKAEVIPHAYAQNYLATLYSAPVRLQVQNAVTVNFDGATFQLAAGAEGKVKGKIVRTAPFAGPVDLALGGLPEGYKTAAVTIPADKDTFELSVTAPAEKEAKSLPNLPVAIATAGRSLGSQNIELKIAPAPAK
ncbi:MAG: LamG-like jellyroll fold domain-containing protein [Planctomycetaceae bacterium]